MGLAGIERGTLTPKGPASSTHRMTIICGGDTKSLTGTGMRFSTNSHTTSTLYLSWAEMGTTGAPSEAQQQEQHRRTQTQSQTQLSRLCCRAVPPLCACSHNGMPCHVPATFGS